MESTKRIRWIIRLGSKKRQAGHEEDLLTVTAMSPSVLTPEPSHVEEGHRSAKEIQAPILAQLLLAYKALSKLLNSSGLSFLMG